MRPPASLASEVAAEARVVLARRWRVWWSRPRVDPGRSRRLLIAALPFAVSGVISVLILRFDVILVSLLTSRTETALYDLATRSIEGVAYLGAVIAVPPPGPRRARRHSDAIGRSRSTR